MTVIDKQFDSQPVGAGLVGTTKIFTTTLSAGVAKTISFGKWKLNDVDNVYIAFGHSGTANGSGDAFQGVPDTTADIKADGTGIDLEDVAGGAFSIAVSGEWTYNK